MTTIVKITEEEAMKMALEGNEVVLGGVEVHVRFVRYKGDPGITLEFTPPYGKDDVPNWMEDIDNRLAGLCRQTVMQMNDHARKRLLRLAERDGGNDGSAPRHHPHRPDPGKRPLEPLRPIRDIEQRQ